MRTVEDDEGTRYVLLKESGDTSLVRDSAGRERYVPTADLDPVEGADPLVTAARAIPPTRRQLVTAVRDERSLGLLILLDDRGPTAVRTLLAATSLCESDLHGLIGEFRAAGLLHEVTVGGERGHALTDAAADALAHLRA